MPVGSIIGGFISFLFLIWYMIRMPVVSLNAHCVYLCDMYLFVFLFFIWFEFIPTPRVLVPEGLCMSSGRSTPMRHHFSCRLSPNGSLKGFPCCQWSSIKHRWSKDWQHCPFLVIFLSNLVLSTSGLGPLKPMTVTMVHNFLSIFLSIFLSNSATKGRVEMSLLDTEGTRFIGRPSVSLVRIFYFFWRATPRPKT